MAAARLAPVKCRNRSEQRNGCGIVGLREGEKLHEELIGHGEVDTRPKHPKISHARVNGMSPEMLDHDGWERRLRTKGTEANFLNAGSASAQY